MSFKSLQLSCLIALDLYCDDEIEELLNMHRNSRIVKGEYVRLCAKKLSAKKVSAKREMGKHAAENINSENYLGINT